MATLHRGNTKPSARHETSAADVVQAGWRGPYGGAVVSMVGYRQYGQPQPLHRSPPVPLLRVFFGLDAPVVIAESEESQPVVRAHSVLGPLSTRHAMIQLPRPREGVQLFVHPLAARRVFGAPASRLPGLPLDLRDVFGSAAAAIRERVGDENDWAKRFFVIRKFLAERSRLASGAATARPREEIVEGLRWIGIRGGNGRMDALAAHVCLGPRQLRTVFVDELGIGPKLLSRLVRFQRATELVRSSAAGASGTLAEVAACAGYADHAHFDREFRSFAGISPSVWVEQESFTVRADRLSGPPQ